MYVTMYAGATGVQSSLWTNGSKSRESLELHFVGVFEINMTKLNKNYLTVSLLFQTLLPLSNSKCTKVNNAQTKLLP